MTRIVCALLVPFLVGVGCAGSGDDGGARLTRRGSSTRNGTIGVAALIRVDGEARADIPVTVTFRAGDDEVATERGTLPFCPPATDCWWGESYTLDALGEGAEDVDETEVTVGEGTTTGAETRIVELDVRPTDEGVTMEADETGTIYTIVFDDGEPTWGGFATVRDAPDRVGAEGLVAAGERMRAFLYVGAIGDAGTPGAD